jgi:hypothetical protein
MRRVMTLDERIDRAITASLATSAGRIAWTVASLAAFYACAYLAAAILTTGA